MSATERRFRAQDSGQVIVIVAISFLTLVVLVALVVSVGQVFIARRTAQTAVDAAALAGGYALQGGAPAAAAAAAAETALQYGFTLNYTVSVGGDTVTGDVNIPPTSGTHMNTDHIEVLISQRIMAALIPAWGQTTVNARAVASSGDSGGAGDTVYAIGSSDRPGLQVGNGGSLTMCDEDGFMPSPPAAAYTCVEGGVAQVNSTDPVRAAYNQGGSVGPSDAVTNAVGGITGNWPGANANAPPVADPLSGFQKPQPRCAATDAACWARPDESNWCRKNGWHKDNSKCGLVNQNNQLRCLGGRQVLEPGVYTKTIGGSCDWVFSPGVYVFEGNQAGLSTSSNMRVQQGSIRWGEAPWQARDEALGSCGGLLDEKPCGVLLFFTYGNYPNGSPTGGCAGMSLGGNNPWNLTDEPRGEPAAGVTYSPWAGMVIYFDPAPAADGDLYCAGPSAPTFKLSGSSTVGLAVGSGLIYGPYADLVMDGAGTSAVLAQVVVDQIFVRQGTLVVNLGHMFSKPALPPRLVE